MATVVVNSTATFSAALKSAHAGDTILLAAGTYSKISITNVNFAQDVTVESQSATKPATVLGLYVTNSSGLAFKNLNFSTVGSNDWYPFRVTNSSNVQFSNLNVSGSTTHNPSIDMGSFLITGSTNVQITGSNFHDLGDGITHQDSDNLVFSGNTFTEIENHGIQGSGSSDVTITGNSFTNFWPEPTDHPDAIIFWTDNVDPNANNINISGNVITRGSGGIIQGIMLSQSVGTGVFNNVTIDDNVVIGGMYNGIIASNTNNVDIEHNYVAGFSDMQSWIRVQNSAGVNLANNDTQNLILSANTAVTQTNNTPVAAATAGTGGVQVTSTSLAATAANSTIIGAVSGLHLSTSSMGGDVVDSRAGGSSLIVFGSHNTLMGGPTGDSFVFEAGSGQVTAKVGAAVATAAVNVIAGFHPGDTIDLSAIDPRFHIVSSFDHHADELIVRNEGNGTWDIYGDTTGTGVANFQVHLTSVTTVLNTSDIHL